MSNQWYLYLLECEGGHYYSGITTNLEARFRAHQAGIGAKYTRANRPLCILASRSYPDRSSASIAEARLKKIRKEKKLGFFNESQLLSQET